MHKRLLIGLSIFCTLIGLSAYAQTPGKGAAGIATTTSVAATSTPLAVSSSTPDAVFVEWQQSGKTLLFDVDMPWGRNGAYAKLTANDVKVASTSPVVNPPFAQRFQFKVGVPSDGMYTYVVQLCASVSSSDCAKSSPISVMAKKGKVVAEASLPPEQLSVDRATELAEIQLSRLRLWYIRQEARSRGLVVPSSLDAAPNDADKARLDRVARVLGGPAAAAFPPTAFLSPAGMQTAMAYFPAFCNEAGPGETLDVGCARDVAGYLSYLTYYTSDAPVSADRAMHRADGILRFLGDDTQRFLVLFPREDGVTLASRIKDHPQDAYVIAMFAYMLPHAPEPDLHSAIIGTWMPSASDRARGISAGFGASLDAMSHGAACGATPSGDASVVLPMLYSAFRAKLGFVDTAPIDCESMRPFGPGGSAFLPFYWQQVTGPFASCTLGTTPSGMSIFSDDGTTRCTNDGSVASSTDRYSRAAADALLLMQRIGDSDGLSSTGGVKIDARVGLGTRIIGTYNDTRATDPSTQPKDIPFGRVNTLIYEGAKTTAPGGIDWRDGNAATTMPFSGDCFRAGCPHGLLRQFALAQQKYPMTDFMLGIGGWNGSDYFASLSRDDIRKTFVDSVRAFLVANPAFDGIDVDWQYPASVTIDKDNVKRDDGATLVQTIADLRAMLDGLSANGRTYHLSVGLGASDDRINASDVSRFIDDVDFVRLEAYDLHGPWDATVGHTAPLFSTGQGEDTVSAASALLALRKANISAKKIVLGVPAYGRMYRGVDKGADPKLPGFGATHHTGDAPSFIDYRTIVAYILGKGAYQYVADDLRGAAYLFDGTNLVSYDAPDAIEKKMQYVWHDGYGGVVLADMMGDDGSLGKRILDVIGKQSDPNSCVITRKVGRNLGGNSKGADVFALQTFLRCRGYLPEYVDINGNYTKMTHDAVVKWQAADGLDQTGVVGDQARAKLLTYYLDPLAISSATSTPTGIASTTASTTAKGK